MLRELLRKKSVMVLVLVIVVVFLGVPYASYAASSVPHGTDKLVCEYTVTFSLTAKDSVNLVVEQESGDVPRESFWSYLGDFWTFDTGEVYRVDDAIFAVTTSVLFTDNEGAKTWLFQETREYADEGVFVQPFECQMTGESGSYTVSVTVLVKGATGAWNSTVAWDKEIVTV